MVNADEVWSDLGAAILAEPINPAISMQPCSAAATGVVLVHGLDDLMNVFAYLFATWRVYLHPTQRAVVDASFKSPARVTGGPGKTGSSMGSPPDVSRAGSNARRPR
jgi:hypothetical protein